MEAACKVCLTENLRRVIWRSFSREYCDFSSLGQLLNDLSLEICIMDAGLPELPGIAVLLPVVVPVSSAVRPEAKHIHLKGSVRIRLTCV